MAYDHIIVDKEGALFIVGVFDKLGFLVLQSFLISLSANSVILPHTANNCCLMILLHWIWGIYFCFSFQDCIVAQAGFYIRAFSHS